MSSAQPLATKTRSEFPIGDVVPPTEAAIVPVPATPPRPPLATRIKERIDAFQKTPTGEGITNWVNAVGSVAGYVVPVGIAAGAGYAAGLTSGSPYVAENVMWTWAVAGAIASIGSQGKEFLGNVSLYKRAGHSYPRLAAFRDVMGWFVAPAALAGVVAAQSYGPDIGTWTAAGVGAVFGSIGLSVFSARSRRS